MTDQIRRLKTQLAKANRILKDREHEAHKAEMDFYYRQWDGNLAVKADVARDRKWEAIEVVCSLEDQLAALTHEALNSEDA